jgi:glycosyltransferase A (GT-A) superfamily protein (DUF2064 family)
MTVDADFCVLVIAKAPEPGRVKTRLSPPLTNDQAAQVAAAALLDTLKVAVDSVSGDRSRVVVAWTGQVARSPSRVEVETALAGCVLVQQRGESFAERLVNAHSDAAAVRPGSAMVQIGMDTPQVTVDQLHGCAHRLQSEAVQAVLGPAVDGGWWLLGLVEPQLANALTGVPMSVASTGERTLVALEEAGAKVALANRLRDVDTWPDAVEVARDYPLTTFAGAVRAVSL